MFFQLKAPSFSHAELHQQISLNISDIDFESFICSYICVVLDGNIWNYCVGVLLELARLMSSHSPDIGVDIILFDGEDYEKSGSLEQYFLGSRYWANNPPVPGYKPRFGILLDMVGGVNARFPKERYSVQYAPALVNEIWSIAEDKGYGDIFVDEQGTFISDDHVVINRILNIPTIDVIRHQPGTEEIVFAPYWHTQQDDMDIISKETLQAVGEVMAELIYNRI